VSRRTANNKLARLYMPVTQALTTTTNWSTAPHF